MPTCSASTKRPGYYRTHDSISDYHHSLHAFELRFEVGKLASTDGVGQHKPHQLVGKDSRSGLALIAVDDNAKTKLVEYDAAISFRLDCVDGLFDSRVEMCQSFTLRIYIGAELLKLGLLRVLAAHCFRSGAKLCKLSLGILDGLFQVCGAVDCCCTHGRAICEQAKGCCMSDLVSTFRKLVALVAPDRQDEAYALVGGWMADNVPYRGLRRRGRRSGPRKATALVKLCTSIEAPLSKSPDGETEAEARVRIIGDTIKRCKMFDAAGMRFKTPDGWDDTEMMQYGLERDLTEARHDVRFERGDY